ncbi:uncharacterized protein LOC124952327 [Vespa velutina]|uniref:uncharacterized protein LOC124952327 n=1 Tax=Vespa velutina TaxID=202808 RepID=UPI001FB3A462|nr:uncharacterized protein LOC124952327 [Vespa velutina]XP_047357981.1 uncharacterized protein LOC124952327 [Vespa velutina]
MSINPMKWKTKNIIYTIIIISMFYYLFIHKKTMQMKNVGIINNTHPIYVWEFVADFSNMRLLNPLIDDFNITAESGNYDHWQYSVEYNEHLRYIPFIKNFAVGHYSIKKENDDYLINSNHNTCFFGFICVRTTSEFRFEKYEEKNTRCTETVEYHCPITVMFLCDEEVKAQRNDIMDRLKAAFSSIEK